MSRATRALYFLALWVLGRPPNNGTSGANCVSELYMEAGTFSPPTKSSIIFEALTRAGSTGKCFTMPNVQASYRGTLAIATYSSAVTTAVRFALSSLKNRNSERFLSALTPFIKMIWSSVKMLSSRGNQLAAFFCKILNLS